MNGDRSINFTKMKKLHPTSLSLQLGPEVLELARNRAAFEQCRQRKLLQQKEEPLLGVEKVVVQRRKKTPRYYSVLSVTPASQNMHREALVTRK